MAIRTSKLADGFTDLLGTVVTAYTVATGEHVRLRRSTVMTQVANGQASVLIASSTNNVYLINATPAAVNAPLNDAGDHVLEAGDTILVFAAVGTRVRYWLSGTVYTN